MSGLTLVYAESEYWVVCPFLPSFSTHQINNFLSLPMIDQVNSGRRSLDGPERQFVQQVKERDKVGQVLEKEKYFFSATLQSCDFCTIAQQHPEKSAVWEVEALTCIPLFFSFPLFSQCCICDIKRISKLIKHQIIPDLGCTRRPFPSIVLFGTCLMNKT